MDIKIGFVKICQYMCSVLVGARSNLAIFEV